MVKQMIAIFYGLLLIGFLLTLIPPIIPLAQHKKVEANEFSLNVFLPTTIGILLMIGGFYGILYDMRNDFHWQVLIALTAAGAIIISCVAGFQSVITVRWRAD